MKRLFWLSLGVTAGVVGTVLLARRVQATVRRYTPEGVAEQVEQAGRSAATSLGRAWETFRTARAEREAELTAQMLVEPEGGDARAVFGRKDRVERGSRRSSGLWDDSDDWPFEDEPWSDAVPAPTEAPSPVPDAAASPPADPAPTASPGAAPRADRARPPGRVDPDEPLTDF